MTPAQEKALAVALDGLKEHEVEPADVVRALFDEATAARMLRGQSPIIEHALARYHRYNDGTFTRSLRSRGIRHRAAEEALEREWAAVYEEIEEAMKRVPQLSPPETPAGVHAPQPQAPQAGTRTPVGISYVSPRHVCEGPREDCWCAALPGAGAG